MMKRKNLAKYFAIAGCALCLPLALVGCGDPSIVDTSGNYNTELNATQMSEYIDQTATIAESTKSYQFRVVFEMSGQNVSQRIEGEGNVDFTTGEMMFDASISASANGESLDYHGSVYYDGLSYYEQNGNAWENVQNSNITSGFNVLAGYCSYDILESYKNVVDDFIGYKAEKDGEVLICVTLNAPNDWNDHTELFRAGFDAVKAVSFGETELTCDVPVAIGVSQSVTLRSEEIVSFTVSESENVECRLTVPHMVYAPVISGQTVGKAEFYCNGIKIGEIRLVASETVTEYREEEKKGFFEKLFS